MRPLPATPPDSDRRFVTRVAPQPYVRFDRNDYSLDPRLVGRRVEVRATQAQITAVCLDTGELACRHARVFAGGLAFTNPAHQQALQELRGERRCRRTEPDVELRPLARYDRLIPVPPTRQRPRRPTGRNRLTDHPPRPRRGPQNAITRPDSSERQRAKTPVSRRLARAKRRAGSPSGLASAPLSASHKGQLPPGYRRHIPTTLQLASRPPGGPLLKRPRWTTFRPALTSEPAAAGFRCQPAREGRLAGARRLRVATTRAFARPSPTRVSRPVEMWSTLAV